MSISQNWHINTLYLSLCTYTAQYLHCYFCIFRTFDSKKSRPKSQFHMTIILFTECSLFLWAIQKILFEKMWNVQYKRQNTISMCSHKNNHKIAGQTLWCVCVCVCIWMVLAIKNWLHFGVTYEFTLIYVTRKTNKVNPFAHCSLFCFFGLLFAYLPIRRSFCVSSK